MRVLIVDDSAANRLLLEEALAELEVEIDSTDSGERALELAARDRPEVVLLDLQMPGIGGLDTCRRLKSPPRPFTYVILVSGDREALERNELDGSLADGRLVKPYTLHELRAVVREALETARAERARPLDQ